MIVVAIIGGGLIATLSFVMGRKSGQVSGRADSDKQYDNSLSIADSQHKKLQREVSVLNNKLEKHISFLIKIPETVKNLNAELSQDDTIKSTMRLVRQLIDTDKVEIYILDRKQKCLKLSAAMGTNRGEALEVRSANTLVGQTAKMRMVTLKSKMRLDRDARSAEILDMAAPIMFQKEVMGVIAIGRVTHKTGNEQRFLAMVGDLAGIAFKNAEHMTTARKDAITDGLTGLYNKRHFNELAVEVALKAANYDFPYSIFMFDIDNFKHYNDTNGHTEGDVLLKELGKLLKGRTRSSNVVARYGGEEFIVLLENCTKDVAMRVAEDIRGAIETHPFSFRERQPLGCLSVSGGVAGFPDDGRSLNDVIKAADKALYESKHAGRNRVSMFQSSHFSEE